MPKHIIETTVKWTTTSRNALRGSSELESWLEQRHLQRWIIFLGVYNYDTCLCLFRKLVTPMGSKTSRQDVCLETHSKKGFWNAILFHWQLGHRKRMTKIYQKVFLPSAGHLEGVLIKLKLRINRSCNLLQVSWSIRKIWRSFPKEYTKNLVQSMPQRCQVIINSKGDWTTY